MQSITEQPCESTMPYELYPTMQTTGLPYELYVPCKWAGTTVTIVDVFNQNSTHPYRFRRVTKPYVNRTQLQPKSWLLQVKANVEGHSEMHDAENKGAMEERERVEGEGEGREGGGKGREGKACGEAGIPLLITEGYSGRQVAEERGGREERDRVEGREAKRVGFG